jgi:hypothetical protein
MCFFPFCFPPSIVSGLPQLCDVNLLKPTCYVMHQNV